MFFFVVCAFPFSLSPISFFIKRGFWSFLSFGLKRQKVRAFIGVKNGLGLTTCKEQQVGFRAFVSLGAPGSAFLNTDGKTQMSLD